jgi:uncharacterized membrane protein
MLTGLKSISELRAAARTTLKGRWGKVILACFIFTLITNIINTLPTDDYFGWILGALVFVIAGAWSAGLITYNLHLIRQKPLSIKLLFSQLPHLLPFFILVLRQTLFILLWALLLVIPGLIASLRYSQSIYIKVDNPEMKASEVINHSKAMMHGQKWKYVLMHLSFIGWFLLCIPTLGIGLLWLMPYIYATQASFYEDLRLRYQEQQVQLP